MIGYWRISWLHLTAYAAGVTVVLGLLVYGTIQRINQIGLVSAQTMLVAADAVAAAVAPDAGNGDWATVQERVRAMASRHMRVRYRVVGSGGTVLADSERIRVDGRSDALELPVAALAEAALVQGRSLDAAGAQSTEMMAAVPLFGSDGHSIGAALVVEAGWERQYLELRTSIEHQAMIVASVSLLLVLGAFVAMWRLGAEPLHRLRAIAEAAAAGALTVRVPAFHLADLHGVGTALNRLLDRVEADQRVITDQRGRLDDHETQRRRLEDDVARAQAEIAALKQVREAAETANAAKSEFLARMSHDLRTPLHGIIGFAEMIRDQMVGPIGTEKYISYAQDIHQSGVHLLRLINDVLDISKIEAGHFELASDHILVGAVIEESVHAASPLAWQRHLTLTAEIPPNLPRLMGDERTVRQMMFNLLSNAIKFTEPGGVVTVTAQQVGERLDITVADNGMGIDAGDLDVVFTEFGQAGNPRTRPAEGTGLGLVIVKSLIELHEGQISLQSEPGIGTAVTLSFPPERLCREP